MATAIVTGASSGIGRAIARMLLSRGYHVIGISRYQGDLVHESFEFVACDLRDFRQIEALSLPSSLDLVVNAAGFGRFEPHESLSSETIIQMIALNLQAPILLIQKTLRVLKKQQGLIINIASIEATRASKFSALYSATKSGLRAFGMSLFEEVRRSGVGVLTIHPDMTDTPFFDPLSFGVGEEPDVALMAEDIAHMVAKVLDMRPNVCTTELTIRPQRFGIHKKQRQQE